MSGQSIAFMSVAILVVGGAIHWSLVRAPLDIIDFPEFMPLLEKAGSFAGGLAALAEYFGGHGRFNVLTQTYISLIWLIAGDNAAAWQAAAWLMMAVLGGLVASFANELGMSRAAVGMAVALTVLGSPGAGAWVRFTGEPLGAILFVCSLKVALRYREFERPGWHAGVLALLWSAMVLAKETLVVLIPVAALVALTSPPAKHGRGIEWSRASPVVGALVVAAMIIAVAWMATHSGRHPTAYASAFGEGELSIKRFVRAALVIVLPSRVNTEPPLISILYPANILYTAIVIWASVRVRREYLHSRLTLAVCLTVACVMVGGLIYLPWPRFESFYALPFAIGPLALFGMCVSRINARRVASRAIAGVMLVVMMLYAGALSWSRSEGAAARRAVEHQASLAITAAEAETLIVVRRYSGKLEPSMAWERTAASLERHSREVLGRKNTLSTVDVPCELLSSVPVTGKSLLVLYDRECNESPVGMVSLERTHWRLSLLSLELVRDTFSVAIRYPSNHLRSVSDRALQ
jgi:hypothetical protein